jgi:autotransporter-associated beta strand protein
MKTRNLFAFLIVMALFGGTPSAWAVWTGATSGTTYASGGTGDYDYTGNWAGSTIDDSFLGFLLTGNLTVTLDAARTTGAGGLNFNYDGNFNLTLTGITSSRILTLAGPISADTVVGGKTITIGGGSGVSLSLGTTNRDVTVGTGDTLIIANASQNTTGGITKKGAGLLQLNAANLWTGLTQVDAGELRWGITDALSSGNLTINNGGTVNIQSFNDTVGTITIAKGGSITGSIGVLTTGSFISNDGGTMTNATLLLANNASVTYNSTGPGSTTLQIDRVSVNDSGNNVFNIAKGDAAVDFDITGAVNNGGNNVSRTITKTGTGVMQFSGSTVGTLGQNGVYLNINEGTVLMNRATGVSFAPGTGYAITVGDSTGSAGSAILKFAATGGDNQLGNRSITINSDGLFDLNGKTQTGTGTVALNGTGQMDFNGNTQSVGAVTIVATGAGANTTPIKNTAGTGGLTVASLAVTPVTGYISTLSLGGSGTLTLGGDVTFNAAGTGRAQITGSALSLGSSGRTFNIGLGTGADYDLLVGAGISGASRSLTKTGAGRLVLTGSNSYSGGTIVNVGTLQIGDGTTAGTMTSTGALTLGGGTFVVRGPASGGSSQTVASLASTASTVSAIKLTPGASGNTVLTITSATLSTGAGSAVNFDYTAGTTVGGTVGNNYVAWSPTLTAGIIGGAYTVTDSGGTGFATTSGGNVVRLTDSGSAGLPVSGGSSTASYFVGSGYSTNSTTTPGSLVEALAGAVAANNVTVDTAGLASGANLALGANLLTLGAGMVISGPNPYEISGSGAGGLKAAASGGTINLYNASSDTVTISAPVVNNTASRLTVDGPGTTILSGVNTYTGATVVNGGIVKFSGTMAASPITINNGVAQLGTATGLTSANTVTFGAGSTGSLQLLGNSVTIGALNSNAAVGTPVIANNNGGSSVANATLTINSASASTFGGVIQDGTGGGTLALTKSGAGTLTLGNANNTYRGGTVINGGKVQVGSSGNNPPDTVLGDISGSITLNGGGLIVLSSNLSSVRSVVVGASGGSISVSGNNNFTTSGLLTGSGTLTFGPVGGSGGQALNFNSTANDFTGAILIPTAYPTVSFNSLADSANKIVFSGSTGGAFTWNTGAIAPLVLNGRQFELAGTAAGQSYTINNANTSPANIIVIAKDLLNTTANTKTLVLTSANTGTNTFAGNISDATGGGVLALTKSGAGNWMVSGNMSNTGGLNIGGGKLTLSGNNTYSGQTIFTAAGTTLILAGTNAVSPNTSFLMNNNVSTSDSTAKLLDDTGNVNNSTVSVPNTFTIQNNNAPGNAHTFIVGNNNTANGGTSSGTTTGSTIAFGTLNWNTYASGTTAYGPIQIQGTDGYRLQINSVVLHNAVNLTSGTVGNTFFTPTTANATLGTVTVGNGNTGQGYQTLVMDGTSSDNRVTGAISDASDVGTSGRPLRVTKSNTSTWTLSGNNTYSGGTTITAGKLLFSGANALPTTGTVTVSADGHLSLTDGTARSQTVSALTLTSLASLSFDWTGSGTGDQLTSTANITPTAGSGFYVNLNRSGTPGGSVTLLTGGASSTLSSSTFYLANATDYTATFTTTPTTLSVGSFTSQTPLTTFYWVGDKLSATIAGVRNAWALSDGTKGNWSSTTPAYTATPLTPGATADVIFANGQTGKTQQSTVLGADVTVNSVTIDDSTAVTIAGSNGAALTLMGTSGTAGTVASPGSAISVTANANATSTISSRVNLGADQTWHVATNKTLAVSGIVGGTFGLTKASPGTLTLSALPEYTVATTISDGALTFGGGLAGGASIIGRTSAITLSQGATLNFNTSATGINNIYTAGAPITLSGGAGTANIRVAGNDVRLYVGGNVTGQAGVAQTLSISQGLQPNGATSNGDRQNIRFSGVIANGGSGGTLGVSVNFAGSSGVGQNAFVNLSGQNTFTGDLAVTNSRGLNGGNPSSHPGAWLTIGGERYSPNATIIANIGNGYLGGRNYSGNISLSAGAGLTTLSYLSTANQTLGGIISGTGSLQMDGTGTLTLSGNNTFSGATTVNAGTLALAGSSCLSDTNRLTVASGAKVQLDAGVREKVGLLTLGSTPQASGTWGSTSSAAANKTDTYFSGTGVLYVGVDLPPAGTLITFF